MPAKLIETLREIESEHPYATIKDGSRDWTLVDLINSLDESDETTFTAKTLEDGRIHIYPMRWDGLYDPNGQPWFTVYPAKQD